MGKIIITNKEIYNEFIKSELDVKRGEAVRKPLRIVNSLFG